MQSNPFGDAKPVDAEAKLREIEERERKRKVSCSFRPCYTPLRLSGLQESVQLLYTHTCTAQPYVMHCQCRTAAFRIFNAVVM